MPDRPRRPFVSIALFLSGCFVALIGVIQVVTTFKTGPEVSVILGMLCFCSSSVLFGLAWIIRHLSRR